MEDFEIQCKSQTNKGFLCYSPISLDKFPDACKLAKLKSLLKKESNSEASNYQQILLLPWCT